MINWKVSFIEKGVASMSKRKTFLIVGLFLLALTCFRIPWLLLSLTPTQIEAKQGILDLREWDFDEDEAIALDGEWEFYPSTFLTPDSIHSQANLVDKTIISVPGNWHPYFPAETDASAKYATYRLRILVADEQLTQQFKLQLPRRPLVSEVIVNGSVVIENTATKENVNNQISSLVSRSITFEANEKKEIEILIHVPANSMSTINGIGKSIQLGNAATIDNRYNLSTSMQLLVAIIALLHFVYSCIIFFMSRLHRVFIYFGMVAFCAALSVLLDDDRLLLQWTAIDYVWSTKLLILAYIGIAAFSLLFIQHFFSEYKNNKFAGILTKLLALFAVLLIVTPYLYIPRLVLISIITIVVAFATIAVWMWNAVKKGEQDLLFLVLAASSVVSSFIWAFYKDRSLTELPFYPTEIVVAFLSFSAFLFSQFLQISKQNKQLTIELQKEIKQKDDFLANTSHELRNPLHGIINIAQSVLDTGINQLDDKNKNNVELLVTIGRHMSQTLNDLLDISRLKEHRIQLQQEQLNLQAVAEGVIDMLALMIENKNIRLELQISNDFPHIVADKNRVIQILFNLLHNAVKFTDEGVIAISADVQNGRASIHVTDTGIGMDEETKHRIFQPYEQGDSSLTAMGSGLGLGLSICRQLVDMHGGLLTVDSILGQGTQFTFTLPLADETVEQSVITSLKTTEPDLMPFDTDPFEKYASISTVTQTNKRSYKPKILAVDDNPINLQVLANILSDEQYDVVTVTSGKEAIKLLDSTEWDLLITDVMMPYMSGYELTRSIRKKYSISELPILLLTARSQPEDIYTGFLAGANDYVAKPVNALELKVRVYALTDLKESISERLRMEAAWLQAQIQPHFLFNTLNTIMSLSEIDTTRMALLLDKFGHYLRRSFDFKNMDRFVPLTYEIELLESYLYIEKERFGDRLQVQWEIEELDDLRIPPLSIQTLVENAVRHGILQQLKGGNIHIRARRVVNRVEIAVIDDGIGMDAEKVAQILTSQPDKKRGVGLLNTDQRLKQLYGEGLNIVSVPGEGTTVSFKIPMYEK